MRWITPTGNVASGWTDPGKAHDGLTGGDPAYQDVDPESWSGRLELTHAGITDCGGIRLFVNREHTEISIIKVELYYDGGWNLLYQGDITTLGSWWQFNIGSTVQNVTKIGISFYNQPDNGGAAHEAYVYEGEFGQIPAGRPLVGGGLAR